MTIYTILYHAGNYRGLACMLINAVDCRDVEPSRLERPPRGKFVQEANYVRAVYAHQRSIAPTLSQKRFATKVLKVSITAWNNWIDGLSNIRSDSLRKISPYAPPHLRPPLSVLSSVDAGTVDPGPRPTYDTSSHGEQPRGYMVRTLEAELVARWIDRIADDDQREAAALKCLQELKGNPRGVVADRRPDRPTTSKP